MKKMLLIALASATLLPFAAGAQEYQVVERPRQECWNEQVAASGSQDIGGALIGGLAGGIIGNQVGKGNGRTVATAVGAMTGAVVGDRLAADGPGYRTVRRCRTVMERVEVPVAVERRPVYVQPQPVYVQPQPVYVRPAPVTVVEQPVYYLRGEEPRYRHEHWRHEWRERPPHRYDD